MQTKVIHYFDDETLEHVGEKFYIDGEEVSFEDYADLVEGLFGEDVDVEEDCSCNECCECCDEIEEEPEEIEAVCDDDCEDCDHKEECLDISIIEEFADEIINAECCCESCLKNKLYELFVLGKKIGWHDHKRALIELLEE